MNPYNDSVRFVISYCRDTIVRAYTGYTNVRDTVKAYTRAERALDKIAHGANPHRDEFHFAIREAKAKRVGFLLGGRRALFRAVHVGRPMKKMLESVGLEAQFF